MRTAALFVLWFLGPFALLIARVMLAPEEWGHAVGRGLIPILNVCGICLWIVGAFRLIDYWSRKRASRDCGHLQTVTRCDHCGRVLLGDFKVRGTLA